MKTLFQSILEKALFYALFISMFLFTAVLRLFYLIYQKFFISIDKRSDKKSYSEKKGLLTQSII
jgi:hypothetical protein